MCSAPVATLPRYVNHLGRTISSTALHSAASLHDDLSKSTFMSSLLLSHLLGDQWLQASLPIRLGGFGVPLLSPILDAAFLAGWSHTSEALPDRFPSLSSVDDLPFVGTSVRCSLEFALRRFQESFARPPLSHRSLRFPICLWLATNSNMNSSRSSIKYVTPGYAVPL